MISLQAFHPLQVGGQAIIQALHSLLLTLDAPYAYQTPTTPAVRPLDPQLSSMLLEWDTEIWEPGTSIDAGCNAGQRVTAQSPESSSLWRSWSTC